MRRLRELGTRDLLTQLIGVDGSTVTWAARQVQPLLADDGYTIPHSTDWFRTPAGCVAVQGFRCDACLGLAAGTSA